MLALTLGAGAGGYLLAHSQEPDVNAAREAGEKAGRAAGTKDGTEKGYEEGFAKGVRSAYRKAYDRAYRRALAPPGPVDVDEDSTPGTSAD